MRRPRTAARALARATTLARAITLAVLAGACSPAPSAPPSVAPASPSPVAAASPGPTHPGGAATPQASLDRVAGWQADIGAIVPGLERIHPNPFHGTSKADLEAAAAQLAASVPTATDDQLMVGIARIAALVSAKGCDGHTGLFVWGTGSYPVTSLPLRLWLFDDDVVIVDALPPYTDLIGSRIATIDDHPIGTVLNAIATLVPKDNHQTIRLVSPRYLLIPEVLQGLGLASAGAIRLRTEQLVGGRDAELEITPIPMADYNSWAGPYGLHLPLPPADRDVRFLSRIDDDLWWEMLPDNQTLYVQYNRVELVDSGIGDLEGALAGPEVQRVVLDIRNNFGGEVRPLDAMVDLFASQAVNQPGKLFVVTGRNTFSAASMLAARLEARTGAVFVGEPMSGCPTTYGNTVELPLRHSGLSLLVSSTLEVGVDPDDTRTTIPLDAAAELSPDEWAAGEDPALDLILVAAP